MKMRRLSFLILALLMSAVSTTMAQSKPRPAEDVMAEAQAKAQSQNKKVLVVFGASWCGYCRLLDKFLAAPEIHPILERHFVLAHLSIQEELGRHPELNSPGGEQYFTAKTSVAVSGETGVPLFLILDDKGGLLASSLRPTAKHPTGENIGYPVEPEEIDWFLTMLQKSNAGLSAEETTVVDGWLKAHAAPIRH